MAIFWGGGKAKVVKVVIHIQAVPVDSLGYAPLASAQAVCGMSCVHFGQVLIDGEQTVICWKQMRCWPTVSVLLLVTWNPACK